MQNQQLGNVNAAPNELTRLLTVVSDSPLANSSPVCVWLMHCLHALPRPENPEECNVDSSTYRGKLFWAAIIGVPTVIGAFIIADVYKSHIPSTQLPITNITVTNTSHLVDAATIGIANLAESSPSFLNMVFDQVANVSPETIALASAAILAAGLYAAGDDIKQSVASSVTSLAESGYSLFKKAAEFAGYSSMPAKVPSLTV
jgi:hypothetical protein